MSPISRAALWLRAARAGLAFRCVCDSDLPFLYLVYASTRADELAIVPWSEAQKQAFLEMQFRAQHAHYQEHYASAERLVILRGDVPVGRLYLERAPGEHRVVDIALLPGHRGQGLGSALMRDLLDEAEAAGKPLSIHVEKNNPALRLYRRLGFASVAEHGLYDLMQCPPPPQVNTAS